MARTLIVNHRPGPVVPAPVAIDATNGMYIDHLPPFGKNDAIILLHVSNTAVAAKTVIVRASDLAPAFGSDKFDKAHTVPAGGEMFIPIDAVRHQHADHSYRVDFEAGTTGTALAIWAK